MVSNTRENIQAVIVLEDKYLRSIREKETNKQTLYVPFQFTFEVVMKSTTYELKLSSPSVVLPNFNV